MWKVYASHNGNRALVSEWDDEWKAVAQSRDLRWDHGQTLPGIEIFIADITLPTNTTFPAMLEAVDDQNRSIALKRTAELQK